MLTIWRSSKFLKIAHVAFLIFIRGRIDFVKKKIIWTRCERLFTLPKYKVAFFLRYYDGSTNKKGKYQKRKLFICLRKHIKNNNEFIFLYLVKWKKTSAFHIGTWVAKACNMRKGYIYYICNKEEFNNSSYKISTHYYKSSSPLDMPYSHLFITSTWAIPEVKGK